MRELFVNAEGRVRSGWVVLVFALPGLFLLSLAAVVQTVARVEAGSLDDWGVLVTAGGTCVAAVVPSALCVLLFKEPIGLDRSRWARRLGAGALVGGLVITAAAVAPPLFGHGALRAGDTPLLPLALAGLQQLVTLGPAAVGEELLVRGVPLRALQRGTGSLFAVAATGTAFGLLHLGNPHASPVGVANVVLVGWFFGALAVRSGSLWMPLGAHLAWNWVEGFVFGLPVSGLRPGRAVFTSSWPEPGFFSGGGFGPEASGWTAVVLLVALAATLAWPRRPPGAPSSPERTARTAGESP